MHRLPLAAPAPPLVPPVGSNGSAPPGRPGRARRGPVLQAVAVVVTVALAVVSAVIAGTGPARADAPPPGGPGANGPCGVSSSGFPNPVDAAMTVTVFEPTGAGAPDGGGTCGDDHRPVVFFAHGFSGTNPAGYYQLEQNLVSRGFIVVYAAYPVQGAWYSIVDGGFVAATGRTNRMNLADIGFIGHSFGGGMTPWLVQQAAARPGWGTHSLFAALIAPWSALQLAPGPIQWPRITRLLVIDLEQDTVIDNRVGVELYRASDLPPDRKEHRLLLSDPAHGLTAGHLTVNQFTPTELSTWGIFRPIDALADCARAGTNCAVVNDEAMGVGADGVPITRALSDDVPVDANPPWVAPAWECTRPVNGRGCDPYPSMSVIRDQAFGPDTTSPTLALTVGDDATAAGSLTVQATSDNPALVPAGQVQIGGSGPDRTVVVAPLAGQTGTAVVTLTTTDGDGHASARSFRVTISPAGPGESFHPMAPVRILDSRTAVGGWSAQLAAGTPRTLAVAGVAGVPADAGSAVLNVTATNPTANTFVTVYPAGAAPPTASTLNVAANQTIANLVTAKIGQGGRVAVANAVGQADVVVDLVGYYDELAGDRFTAVAPTRLLDSRGSTGGWGSPLPAGAPRDVVVAGAAGVPATAHAVVANVTATAGSHNSFLTVWPSGAAAPNASNVNFAAHQTIPNLVTVAIGANGRIRVANAVGAVDVVIDVVGYYDPTTGDRFHPLAPTRVLDSRGPVGGWGGRLAAGAPRSLVVTGRAGVPTGATAIVANTTVTGSSANSFLTVHPAGGAVPNASNLNFGVGETIANLAVKVGAGGQVGFDGVGSTGCTTSSATSPP
jgi:hypothetical protein